MIIVNLTNYLLPLSQYTKKKVIIIKFRMILKLLLDCFQIAKEDSNWTNIVY